MTINLEKDQYEEPPASQCPRCARLLYQNESLRADAERYRWLKGRKGLDLHSDKATWTRRDGSKFESTHYLAEGGTQHAPKESLDATIDAAMALRREEG